MEQVVAPAGVAGAAGAGAGAAPVLLPLSVGTAAGGATDEADAGPSANVPPVADEGEAEEAPEPVPAPEPEPAVVPIVDPSS